MTEQSALLLKKQLLELKKKPVEGFSAGLANDDDVYKWEVLIIGPQDTPYEGGFFKAGLDFPREYPHRPPKMKITTEIWHPNIDKEGNVCISILHEPGDDKWGYEKASERWLPIHTVESILISVISMLADPNDQSPANVDAAVMNAYSAQQVAQRADTIMLCYLMFGRYAPGCVEPGFIVIGRCNKLHNEQTSP